MYPLCRIDHQSRSLLRGDGYGGEEAVDADQTHGSVSAEEQGDEARESRWVWEGGAKLWDKSDRQR